MALYRFFFAPVLLAIAVLAARVEKAHAPPPAPPAARAPERPAAQPSAADDRARPVRSARSVPRAPR